MEVIARIDISTPAGRTILRELESKRQGVTIEYPEPVSSDGTPVELMPVRESARKAFEKLGEKYNTTFENKYTR